MAAFSSSIPIFFTSLTSTFPRKCLTSSIIWLTADGLSQHLIENKAFHSHDYLRSVKHSLYGGLILAPSMSLWLTLTKEVVLKGGPTSGRTVAARVALDQLVMAVVGLSMFGTYSTLTNGGGSREIVERLDRTWKTTLTTSWSIWIPAQFINYALVPPPQRILVMNFTSLIWSCYLSNAAHGAVDLPSAVQLSKPLDPPIPQALRHLNSNSTSKLRKQLPNYHDISNWGRLHS